MVITLYHLEGYARFTFVFLQEPRCDDTHTLQVPREPAHAVSRHHVDYD